MEDGGLWYSQVLPPSLESRDALLDAVTNGVELYRQSGGLLQWVATGSAFALPETAPLPTDLAAGSGL